MFISETDYICDYCGESIPSGEFERYAARAEEAVDAASGWRIGLMKEGEIDAFVLGQIRLAICAQIEYLWLNGAEAALNGQNAAGYQIGKTQVSVNGCGYAGLCRKALHALAPTGLLYAGVRTC